jgi:hypothetical protein
VRNLKGALQRVPSGVWFLFLFLVFGVVQLVPGCAAVWQSIELSRHGLHSDGVVEAVKYHESSFCYNGTCNDWTEVTVSFTDAHGVARRVSRSGAQSTRAGDRVHVTYAPDDPERLRWNGSIDQRYVWLFNGTACVVLGAGVGIAEWVKTRRQRITVEQPKTESADG